LVVLGVKSYDLAQVAKEIEPFLGTDTMVMTVQNGIPWWYFQRAGGSLDGTRLQSLDPSGVLSRSIDAKRIIGCVAYPAAALVRPGVIVTSKAIDSPSASSMALRLIEPD
jgi:2-dehydropantoate 2-reductase